MNPALERKVYEIEFALGPDPKSHHGPIYDPAYLRAMADELWNSPMIDRTSLEEKLSSIRRNAKDRSRVADLLAELRVAHALMKQWTFCSLTDPRISFSETPDILVRSGTSCPVLGIEVKHSRHRDADNKDQERMRANRKISNIPVAYGDPVRYQDYVEQKILAPAEKKIDAGRARWWIIFIVTDSDLQVEDAEVSAAVAYRYLHRGPGDPGPPEALLGVGLMDNWAYGRKPSLLTWRNGEIEKPTLVLLESAFSVLKR